MRALVEVGMATARKRMEKDRHPSICNNCNNYRRCVASQSYCPAYGIAYNYHFGGYVLMNETALDMAKRRAEGWTIRDLCLICNRRCKLTVEENAVYLQNLWKWDFWRKHCPALLKVAGIPCPVYWGEPTDVKEGS